ncbi:hypothetical protein ACFOKI_09520 [Sphingomonas qilianensis]|uniref:MarR family transcriptional regulator n=1 Tax=Sphingomonas qilianensis TaxID=1736690 RepID=A0ABU9XQB7_9SPHN
METVEDLIRDFSSKLGAVAGEFSSRADRIIASGCLSNGASTGQAAEHHDLVAQARHHLAVRKARRRHFPTDLFHEPAWEMLIALFVIYETDHSMNVKALVSCSDAPATTSQRWIDHLHKSGLIDRVTDPIDRRRVDISLSEQGNEAMVRYLTEVAGLA